MRFLLARAACGGSWKLPRPARGGERGGVRGSHKPLAKLAECQRRRVQLARREGEEAVQAIEEGVQLRLRAIVGTAADDRFAGVKQQVQQRHLVFGEAAR